MGHLVERMGCGCRGDCRCGVRIGWRVGFGGRWEVRCPTDCHDCPIKGWQVKASRLVIYHPCLVEPVAVVEDVFSVSKRGLCCYVALPREVGCITDVVKVGCRDCRLIYRLEVDIWEDKKKKRWCSKVVMEGVFEVVGRS